MHLTCQGPQIWSFVMFLVSFNCHHRTLAKDQAKRRSRAITVIHYRQNVSCMLCVTRHGLTAYRLLAACADVNLACDDGVKPSCMAPSLSDSRKARQRHSQACFASSWRQLFASCEQKPTANIPTIDWKYTGHACFRLVCADWVVVMSGPA
jgi:hypothetical protein